MSNITIEKVKNKKGLDDFIKLPWKIYKDNENWVPPLLMERKEFFNKNKNPFFKHADVEYFLAKQGKDIVGRIATIVNYNHIKFHNEEVGFFGFFESINNYQVAEKLLDAAKNCLKDSGLEKMRGPANFSTNEEVGLLIEGFDSPPMIMMTYNPKYYVDFMEKYGMKKAKDIYAYRLDKNVKYPENVVRIAEKLKKDESILVRKANLKDFGNEIKRIKDIYNSAWEKNWGFIPMTDDEFEYLAKNLKQIADPDFIHIAEVNGEQVGFSLALPDFNQILKKLNGRLFPFGIFKLLWYTKINKVIDSARIITMGVKKEYRNKGIDNLFYTEIQNEAVKNKNYKWAEMSWILEDNFLMNRAVERLGGQLYKKYRIYEKELK